MIDVVGNLWQFAPDADARVITTNGSIKSNGEAVMGRGCAYEAARQFPTLPKLLASRIKKHGKNSVFVFPAKQFGTDYSLVTFPVKHEWHENADLDLIFKSACLLIDLADLLGWVKIVCPRFGAGAGKLEWEKVKKKIGRILDDRFYIITFE